MATAPWRRCWALVLVSLPLLPGGINVADKHKAATRGDVARRLAEVDTRVHRAGEDAELVYAQLYTYDQQLETSLGREMEALNATLGKLTAAQRRLTNSGGKVDGQRKVEGRLMTLQVGTATTPAPVKELDRKASEKTVHNLVSTLRGFAEDGDSSQAAGAFSPEVFSALGRLFVLYHSEISSPFPDVFRFFVKQDGPGMLQVDAPMLDVTPALLGRTIKALEAIAQSLRPEAGVQQAETLLDERSSESAALVQEATKTMTGSREEQNRRGLWADSQHQASELAFNIEFTQSVLALDREFLDKLRRNVEKKAALIEEIRSSRRGQLESLNAAIRSFGGASSAHARTISQEPSSSEAAVISEDGGSSENDDDGEPPAGFLQVRATRKPPKKKHVEDQEALEESPLEAEIEAKLAKNEDTHDLLLKIQAKLDAAEDAPSVASEGAQASPVDAGGVDSVVTEFGRLLTAVDAEQSRADAAKRKCESQTKTGKSEAQGLEANVQLMDAAHNQTQVAMAAARKNLKNVAMKSAALSKYAKDFPAAAEKSVAILAAQGRGRRAIMASVLKAGEAMDAADQIADVSVTASLDTVLRKLKAQDGKEHAYRDQQTSFLAVFTRYVQDYMSLLERRQSHYGGSLSALQRYAVELQSDTEAQVAALQTDQALQQETTVLCSKILAFYAGRSERRSRLRTALTNAIAAVPRAKKAQEEEAAAEDDAANADLSDDLGADIVSADMTPATS